MAVDAKQERQRVRESVGGTSMGDWVLAVHAGAGRYGASNEAAYLSLLRSALESGRDLIAQTETAPTAAQLAAHMLHTFERSSLTNAGLGSNLTEQRRVECEASVACGRTRLVGGCAAVTGVREPSALALKLLEQAETVATRDSSESFAFGRQPPLVVVAEHARALAKAFGLETAAEAQVERYQVTEQAQRQWLKWHRRLQRGQEQQAEREDEEDERLDTVGAICMDPRGNVAAALSSGGVAFKVPGRVGLAGCPRMGCDAANAVAGSAAKGKRRKRKRGGERQVKTKNAYAVACSGRGEHFIRTNFVGALTRRLGKSTDLERGLRKTFVEATEDNGGVGIEGGVIALVSAPSDTSAEASEVRRVQLGAAFTTPCMGVGFMQCCPGTEPTAQVQLLRRPEARHTKSGEQLAIHVSFLSLNGDPSS